MHMKEAVLSEQAALLLAVRGNQRCERVQSEM